MNPSPSYTEFKSFLEKEGSVFVHCHFELAPPENPRSRFFNLRFSVCAPPSYNTQIIEMPLLFGDDLITAPQGVYLSLPRYKTLYVFPDGEYSTDTFIAEMRLLFENLGQLIRD
jgi:hypothetical protein